MKSTHPSRPLAAVLAELNFQYFKTFESMISKDQENITTMKWSTGQLFKLSLNMSILAGLWNKFLQLISLMFESTVLNLPELVSYKEIWTGDQNGHKPTSPRWWDRHCYRHRTTFLLKIGYTSLIGGMGSTFTIAYHFFVEGRVIFSFVYFIFYCSR
jgi:hypothetical protein